MASVCVDVTHFFLVQVVDNDSRFIHAAGNLDSAASLSFVFIGDGANQEDLPCPPEELQQAFSAALGSASSLKTPVLTTAAMPERNADDDATILAVALDSSIRELLQKFSESRMVQKGCPSASTKVNAAIELLLYKAARVGRGCTYFAKVIEVMKEYLRSRGYRNFKFRYHINWKDFSKAFCLEHGFHWDSISTAFEAEEAKMIRVIAIVDIPFSKQQWLALKEEVLELKENVPQKQDCPEYEFERENGKLLFPPALYISEPFQNGLTRTKRAKYVQVLKADGLLDQEHLDSDDDDAAAASEDEEAGAGGASSG
jgi:hypothetical protein